MHPRMLARQDCSGGTCPAVYDSDPDLRPDQLAIVGTKASAGLSARLSYQMAPDEGVVVIGRDVVTVALRPAPQPVSLQELQAQFETFSYTAFRLETLQHYAGTGRDEQWITHLKAARRWGKAHQRVHVVIEPLTPAMQEELTAGYEGNVAAGEDIRIIAGDDWPEDLPVADFWLFDSSALYAMHYVNGEWVGAHRITDPEQIVEACRMRDAVLHRAVSWHTYIASHPDLQRRLAQ